MSEVGTHGEYAKAYSTDVVGLDAKGGIRDATGKLVRELGCHG